MAKEDLSAIERVKIARHPERPYSMDLFSSLFDEFIELHGDRRYADDPALVCGFARFDNHDVVVIGHQKGRDTNQRRVRNFGMPKPEGYRKALRVMKLAEKFSRPIITFVDTPGAYPGIDAEERGQAEAIAYNLREMSSLKVPIISVILGEGGSGGALAIAIADRILMLENAVYSVISPEGCAAILFKDASKADRAAASLRLTAEDLIKSNLVDGIVKEPSEWKVGTDEEPSENHAEISANLKTELLKVLNKLESLTPGELLQQRFNKFREMGVWTDK